MITPKTHQIKFSVLCWELLKVKGYVFLAGKPRSGKTLTALLTAEKSDKINSVLILTTKAAIGYPKLRDEDGDIVKDNKGMPKLITNSKSKNYIKDNEEGWLLFLHNCKLKHKYHVTNYEQVGTIVNKKLKLKLNPKDYDLVIIDESHNLGTLAKPSSRIILIKKLCWDMPHIHLSGTAIVESPCGIYHQMSISKYSPFRHKNFYDFHREFGEPYYIKAAGREINQYDKAKDTLMPKINEFTVYMTQEDAGIDKSVQAVDKLHYIELNPKTKRLYNTLQEDNIANIHKDIFSQELGEIDKEYQLVCDTVMKLRTSLHMLESGIAKIDGNYIEMGNTEKIDYILKTFGDTKDIGIMCHFIGERILLKKYFKHVNIYSSTSHAEGIDLSHLKYFIILSSGYSGSKFIQRRDRIVNINGSNTTEVHHILVKKAISEQVYKKVSKKEDFNNNTYVRVAV